MSAFKSKNNMIISSNFRNIQHYRYH